MMPENDIFIGGLMLAELFGVPAPTVQDNQSMAEIRETITS